MSLANLLGLQQAGSIEVLGDPFRLENTQNITQRDVAVEQAEETADRKGMFGVKGTLRDILGLVGDSFLVQGGSKRMYQPRRDQERVSDSMAGFTEDALEAIERVGTHNPALAQRMHEQYMLNSDRSNDNNRQNMAETRQQEAQRAKVIGEVTSQASQLISAAMQSGDPEMMGKVMQQIEQTAKNYNLTLEDIALEAGMDPSQLAVYGQAGMTPYQQRRVPQMERGLDIRQQNADTAGGRASEQQRANRSRESIQRSSIQERRERSLRTDERLKQSSKPRTTLRGSEDDPTDSPRLNIRPVG